MIEKEGACQSEIDRTYRTDTPYATHGSDLVGQPVLLDVHAVCACLLGAIGVPLTGSYFAAQGKLAGRAIPLQAVLGDHCYPAGQAVQHHPREPRTRPLPAGQV